MDLDSKTIVPIGIKLSFVQICSTTTVQRIRPRIMVVLAICHRNLASEAALHFWCSSANFNKR